MRKTIRFDNQKREFYVEQINPQGEKTVLSRSKKGTTALFRQHPDLLED